MSSAKETKEIKETGYYMRLYNIILTEDLDDCLDQDVLVHVPVTYVNCCEELWDQLLTDTKCNYFHIDSLDLDQYIICDPTDWKSVIFIGMINDLFDASVKKYNHSNEWIQLIHKKH